jgi:hypothetical protein
MKPRNSNRNQGEGDKVSARHYNRKVREYVAEGSVDDAAREAKDFVEHEPRQAQRAEAKAKRGPSQSTRVSLDELVARGRTVVDRVRPIVKRATAGLRSRLGRKSHGNH